MAGLDGLRAIAVLAVIAYHLNFGWAQGGMLGVGVFFVLSGYLITDLLLAQRESGGRIQLGRFWLRRARRLLPALWVMLAAVVVWDTLTQPAQLTQLRGDLMAAFFYISNWWYALQHVSYFASFGPPSPLGHLWSLAVEEQFYLLWPLLLIVAARFIHRRRLVVTLVLLGAVLSAAAMAAMYTPGGDPNRIYYGTDTRAFELLIGAALALLWPSRHLSATISRISRARLEVIGVLGLAVVLLMVAYTNEYDAFLYRGGLVLLSLGAAAAVMALAHPATLVGKALGIRPLRWIGVRSYGIYLWHFPIIVMTTPLIAATDSDVLRGAFQVGATLVIAALSWRYIEDPIRRGALRGAVRSLRSLRWTSGALPPGIREGLAAAVLVLGTAGAGLVGLMPSPPAPQQTPQLSVSLNFAEDPVDDAQPDVPCAASVRTADVRAATPPPKAGIAPVQVTAIGDSVMIDVAPFLRRLLPGVRIDGLVSRSMYQLPGLLSAFRAEGALSSRLIIELGTNGPFDEGQVVQVLRGLGHMDRIVLVNAREPRPWQDAVNSALHDVATQVPNTVVADWYAASAGHPEYFWSDAVHPNPQGAKVMAALMAHAVAPEPEAVPRALPARVVPCGDR